ncbi:hydrophobin 2 [Pseudovirgaria hyperparasitica]|uniref:Hydrophobin 2 n=1 Tax=Pseudovirgaria hyperparasitica TaxID=470096 RepID=A0A6A6WAK9_9PEZI|nr:hydrophobin 2 [Pseudovirgaria hyperparasitica]KAF2758627.1 hydrophobin 2 [Pseudovirgaria hyperparasitica]
MPFSPLRPLSFLFSFSLLLFLLLLTTTTTASALVRREYDACTGHYNTAQCCATDVQGVADLDCANPAAVPVSADDFVAVCAGVGQRARCCVAPVVSTSFFTPFLGSLWGLGDCWG